MYMTVQPLLDYTFAIHYDLERSNANLLDL